MAGCRCERLRRLNELSAVEFAILASLVPTYCLRSLALSLLRFYPLITLIKTKNKLEALFAHMQTI